ncbi:MAG: PEP-CTERM sorting domain-containing protein, partial [Planctomycetales bacterium]|nr:PEP-CTERM sorting domain-containing protein [Planctomycetales bacterium]
GADFLTWQRNFGIDDGTALMVDGDANGDGNVNDADLTVWQSQFGTSPATSVVSAVPEPTTLALALGGLTLVLAGRARRRTT